MKKMKRFLVAMLSCLTAVACVAGISACKDSGSGDPEQPKYEININKPADNVVVEEKCEHDYQLKRLGNTTCLEDGYLALTCSKCGDIAEKKYVEETGHTEVVVPAKAATCTATGNIQYTKCAVCDWVSTPDFTTPMLAHTMVFGTDKKVEAGCKTNGYKPFMYCSAELTVVQQDAEYQLLKNDDEKADYLFGQGRVYAVGYEVTKAAHKMVDFFEKDKVGNYVLTVKADCETAGLNNFKYCEVCSNGVDSEDKFADIYAYFTADANKDGVYDNVSEGFEKAIVTALGHNFTKANGESTYVPGIAPTCTEEGLEWHGVCQRCGKDVNKGKTIAALVHDGAESADADEVTKVFTNAKSTIAKCGVANFCGDCGEFWGDVGAHGETVAVAELEATCLTAGHTAGNKCADCGMLLDVTIIPAKGHDFASNWEDKTDTKADDYVKCGLTIKMDYRPCEAEGCDYLIARKNDNDEGSIKQIEDIIEFNDHKISTTGDDYEKAKAATCEDPGSTAYGKCTICEELVGGDVIAAFGHVKYKTVVTYAFDSGDIERKVEDVVDVDYSVPVTCKADNKCALCKKTLEGTTLDHILAVDSNGDFVIKNSKAPTCDSEGIRAYAECITCKAIAVIDDGGDPVYTLETSGDPIDLDDLKLPKLSHNYQPVATEQIGKASCTAVGYAVACDVCTICGDIDADSIADPRYTVKTIVIPKLAHTSVSFGSCLAQVKCDHCDEMIANKNVGNHVYDVYDPVVGGEPDTSCNICGKIKE